MLTLSLIGAVAFVFINAFGAWVTQYRRRRLAWLFLSAAMLLVLAVVALSYRAGLAVWPLGLGLLLTWLSSYLHARLVARRVVLLNHVLRAAAVLAVFSLALLGLD